MNFCYAGMCLVSGAAMLVVGNAVDEDSVLSVIAIVGGFAVAIGVLYLLAGLYWLSRVMLADDRAEADSQE